MAEKYFEQNLDSVATTFLPRTDVQEVTYQIEKGVRYLGGIMVAIYVLAGSVVAGALLLAFT